MLPRLTLSVVLLLLTMGMLYCNIEFQMMNYKFSIGGIIKRLMKFFQSTHYKKFDNSSNIQTLEIIIINDYM